MLWRMPPHGKSIFNIVVPKVSPAILEAPEGFVSYFRRNNLVKLWELIELFIQIPYDGELIQ
jgi:hypothetical protein